MRLNNQILRSRCAGPLGAVEYLDLSGLELVSLERLASCPKVESLILRDNKLQDTSGLDACQQLWHLDLSNNQIQSVEGLSRFLALGTLILSNNQLTWSDLAHLRHINILCLSLNGNVQLEKDPYYRIHVIDCLPNVWMLDGRLVTSAERIKVRQFFQDSALTDRPVRRKLKKDSFVPSILKKIEIDGIFGNKAVQMMTSFPKNAVLNIETDWKRLQYLAQTLQEDISLEWKYTTRKPGTLEISQKPTLLTDLFDARFSDRERCNMVLLMLVASLDFVLPTHLVRDTLDTGKLLTLGDVHTMDLFLLPRLLRCKVVSLLVSAVKVDREQNEDGGLYTKLYLCLHHMVSELTRLSETGHVNQPKPNSKLASQLHDYKCLLATEVVQLMCIVPSFFDYLDRDMGVMNLVRIATADPDINEKLIQISKTKGQDDTSQNLVFKEMADFLLMKVQEQLQNLTNKSAVMSACDRILSKSGALPMKGENNPVCVAEYLVRGVGAPDSDPPALNPRKMSAKTRSKFPHLGDRMLLGPQTVGKIISLPQPTMALVVIDAVPVASGAVEHKLKESDNHYTYVNMDLLEWDSKYSLWKPKGTVGDKFTLQAAQDFNREALGPGMVDESFRPSTPETGFPADLQALRASTPLIYTNTPRQQVHIPTDMGHKSRTRRPQRPLSSVYKERLKLTLDLSRRAQSAGARRPFAVTYGSKTSTPKNPKVANLQLEQVSGMRVDLKGVGHDVESGGCSTAASSTSSRFVSDAGFSDKIHQLGGGQLSAKGTQPVAQSTPKGPPPTDAGKENEPPPAEDTKQDEPAQSAAPEEPTTAAGERETTGTEDETAAAKEKQNGSSGEQFLSPQPKTANLTTRSDPGLNLRDRTAPEAAKREPDGSEAETSEPKKEIFMTAVDVSSRHVTAPYPGHQLAGRSRPVSAIERQVAAGGKMPDNIFHSEFQQQRMNAWKQTTRPASTPKEPAATVPPPPQRPPSPNPNEVLPSTMIRTTSLDTISIASAPRVRAQTDRSILQRRMPRANLWLAGGRDLFWEGVTKRPKSGHTPGWKEGLPDSMKPRPRSAAARLHRRTKTPLVHSPSPTRDVTRLKGVLLNDIADFSDMNQSALHGGTGSSRSSQRYSSQRSLYDEDPLPGPIPDSVYSPLKVWSYQRPHGYLSSNGCLPCLYEDYLDDLDYESQYTPTCNTPTQD